MADVALTLKAVARELYGVSKMRTSSAMRHADTAATFNAEHSRGLLLIGLFKLGKALFFGALGLGALKLVHYNIGDLAQRLVDSTHEALHIDPEGKFVTELLDKADTISSHHVRQAGILAFGYACVCVVEGVGLLKRKVWAEYFTIVLTAGALPWEGYELHRSFTWFKVGFMTLNVLVLLYLLWIVKRMRARLAHNK
jgi:uncharacterized membrane protein (DUF2068 family)